MDSGRLPHHAANTADGNPQLCGPTNPHRAEYSFVIFVDEIFTTLFEPPFTNVSDAIAPIAAISCLYRAGNGD